MPVAWTPDLRSRLTSRTPTAIPPRAIDAVALAKQLQPEWAKQSSFIAKGEFESPVRAMSAWTGGEEELPGAMALGTCLRMLHWYSFAEDLLTLACAKSPALALEAVVLANGIALAGGGGLVLQPALGDPILWGALRRVMLGTGDRRETAIAVAEAMFPTVSRAARLCLAHAFFDRPKWAAIVAREIIDDPRTIRANVAPLLFPLADRDLVAPLLAKRQGLACLLDLVETFGDDALDPLLDLYKTKMSDGPLVAEALSAFDDERAAHVLALQLPKKKTRPLCVAYFSRHPALAEIALVPLGEGRSKAALLARETLEGVRRVKTRASAELQAPEDIPEPLRIPPWISSKKKSRTPKIDPLLPVDMLTRPTFSNGRALPSEAFQILIGILALSSADRAHPMLREAIDDLDPDMLAELAWELARFWDSGSARKRDRWMIDSLAHLANDEVTRRTTPALKHPRIYHVLAAIGTDAAAMELFTCAARNPGSDVEDALDRAAEKHETTRDELEDRVVPTLGVDAEGGIDLDYGARTIRVVFDGRLEPIVLSPKGAPLKKLPDPGKEDDPEKVAEAKRIFAELHEDIGAVAARRIATLERAMISGRTWPLAVWREVWAKHVLMSHLARGVVWIASSSSSSSASSPSAPKSCRLAEDGSLADDRDAPVDLDLDEKDARIGVAHPAELGAEGVARWTTLFGDYELLQPIDQLARAFTIAGKDERTLVVDLPSKVELHVLRRTLELNGLRYVPAQVDRYRRVNALRGFRLAEIRWTLEGKASTTVARVIVAVDGDGPLAELHPVELSETVRVAKSIG